MSSSNNGTGPRELAPVKPTKLIETLKTYFQKHYEFDTLFRSEGTVDTELTLNKYRLKPGRRFFLNLLKISPWFCLIGFMASFGMSIIPVPAVEALYLDYRDLFQAFLTVCVSGLIGYSTNYVAIRMLFRPVQKRPIWGQGLIPAQRDRIINSLARGMHTHILSQELIRKRVEESGLVRKINHLLIDGTVDLLSDNELRDLLRRQVFEAMAEFTARESFREEIRTLIESRIEDSMDDGMKRFLLRTYKRLNPADYEKTINRIVEEIPKVGQEVMSRLETEIDRLALYIRKQRPVSANLIMQAFVDGLYRIDIAYLLRKQMEHFDEARLEKMVWEATNEQLLYIQYLGTLLGILGGLLIWNPLGTLAAYAVIFAVLYGVDILLFRLKKQKMSNQPEPQE